MRLSTRTHGTRYLYGDMKIDMSQSGGVYWLGNVPLLSLHSLVWSYTDCCLNLCACAEDMEVEADDDSEDEEQANDNAFAKVC